MSAPFLSFVSSAYQTEEYVPGMIGSLLAQTDPDWELVVVDNGLSEEMAAVVGAYTHDPRIRLVRQENRGVVGGFARASAEARGRYVSPLASDDAVGPSYVARMREVLTQHPEAVGVGCDASLFSNAHPVAYQRGLARSMEGKQVGPEGGWLSKLDLLDGRMPYYQGTFEHSAWTAVDGLSMEEGTVDEVIRLYVKMLELGPVFVIPDRLGRYRLRDDSFSHDDATVGAFEQRLVNSYRVFGAGATPEEQAAAQRMIARLGYLHGIRRARQAFMAGDTAAARQQAAIAWRHRRTPRTLGILVFLWVAPGLLSKIHPLKRRAADWMLIHSPLDRFRSRSRSARAAAGKVSEPGSGRAADGTPRAGEPSGPPPT